MSDVIDLNVSSGRLVGLWCVSANVWLIRNVTIHQQHYCVSFRVFCLQMIQLLFLRITLRSTHRIARRIRSH